MELRHTATHEGRLSNILKEDMKISTGLMNRLKRQDGIWVNGKPEHTDYPVKRGDVIALQLEEPEPEYPAEEGDLAILYEDDHLLAVDKPAGMLIHPSRSKFDGTLANFVVGYYRKTGQKSAFHPVTRLDRDTFGIVLLAKNSHAHALMQQQDLRKTYHALVLGNWEQDAGIIDAPIARKPLPSLLREIREDGKPSVTRFTVLERNNELCKLALEPVTGRTHQLRLHCCYRGFPILGDPQYNSPESIAKSTEMGLCYQQLCAKQLKLTHPVSGLPLEILSTFDISIV